MFRASKTGNIFVPSYSSRRHYLLQTTEKGFPRPYIDLPSHLCNTAVTRFGQSKAFHTGCLPLFNLSGVTRQLGCHRLRAISGDLSFPFDVLSPSHIRSIGSTCGCSRRNALGLSLRSFPAACPSQYSQELSMHVHYKRHLYCLLRDPRSSPLGRACRCEF